MGLRETVALMLVDVWEWLLPVYSVRNFGFVIRKLGRV